MFDHIHLHTFQLEIFLLLDKLLLLIILFLYNSYLTQLILYFFYQVIVLKLHLYLQIFQVLLIIRHLNQVKPLNVFLMLLFLKDNHSNLNAYYYLYIVSIQYLFFMHISILLYLSYEFLTILYLLLNQRFLTLKLQHFFLSHSNQQRFGRHLFLKQYSLYQINY